VSICAVILEHQVLGDCFVDCVTCLIAFANNKISSRTSLKAIALLRICEDRLADVRFFLREFGFSFMYADGWCNTPTFSVPKASSQ
jgi:hypothetical protein